MAWRWRLLGAVGAIAVHLAVLYVPRTPPVDAGGLPLDKAVHLIAFALPTAALILAGMPRMWAMALMIAHAPVSELVQHHAMANRTGDPGDVLADLLGVALGALLVVVVTTPQGRPAR